MNGSGNRPLRLLWSKSNQAFLPNKNNGLSKLFGVSLRLQATAASTGWHSPGRCE
jgi:hypothetical protein